MKRGKTDWNKGRLIVNNFENIDCSKCDDRYRYHMDNGPKPKTLRRWPLIKFFPESHGYLCHECFLTASLCPCGELAVVSPPERCRACFVGEETKQPFDALIYKSDENADLFALEKQNELEE